MRRGEIWVANLNPNRGYEGGKVRPVLVLQANAFTGVGARTVIVLPLSSQPPDGNPLHIPVSARDRLLSDSIVLVEQPQTLARARVGDGPLAEVTPQEMGRIEKALLAVLGIY